MRAQQTEGSGVEYGKELGRSVIQAIRLLRDIRRPCDMGGTG